MKKIEQKDSNMVFPDIVAPDQFNYFDKEFFLFDEKNNFIKKGKFKEITSETGHSGHRIKTEDGVISYKWNTLYNYWIKESYGF